MSRNIDWRLALVGGIVLIAAIAVLWKMTLGGDPATPTARVEAGSTPVYNASEEGGGFQLPQKK